MRRTLVVPIAAGLTFAFFSAAFWGERSNRAGLALAQDSSKAAERHPISLDRPPVRVVEDTYATFHGIAIDPVRGEVFMTNNNRGATPSIQAYPEEFEATEKVMEPRRRIAGPNAHLGDVCSLTISPEAREMFYVNNDGGDNMGVFPLDATGEITPARELNVPHGAWGVYLEPKADELFISVEHVNRIVVYPRTAVKDDAPLRSIQGPHTELADPHGIYADAERNEIYVANHGHWRQTKIGEGYALFGDGRWAQMRGSQSHRGIPESLEPSTGKFVPPSVTVYPRTGNGDLTPLRMIAGPKTGLNLPLGIFVDTVSHQLVVANSGDDSVLFFDQNAGGDVAPVRVLKGPATHLKSPTGVYVETKHNELWVTNWDDHSATVYPRTAAGNAAPIRAIRSAAKGTPSVGFGTPGAIAYDAKRKEILVPN